MSSQFCQVFVHTFQGQWQSQSGQVTRNNASIVVCFVGQSLDWCKGAKLPTTIDSRPTEQGLETPPMHS